MSVETTLTFLGHSAWCISHGRYGILIDPFITGNPVATIAAGNLNPTHIILSHGHDDHVGDTVTIAQRTGAQVIATFELANYIRRQGVENVWGMGVGGGYNGQFGRVKFTIAHHSSSTNNGEYLGVAAGILLTLGGHTIYHAGDTALFMDMKLIGDGNVIDVALLPIGDNFTMDIDDAVTAAGFLRPKLTIPMHYNTWLPIAADPEQFCSKLQAKGFSGLVLNPGQSYQLKA